jgi:shikimate kinase
MPELIFLTGMMGSGKTTVGKALARRLGRPFADTDAMVVRKAGKSVAEIFETGGEAAFRRLEGSALRSLKGAAVVATGGGMVVKAANRAWMRSHGLVVHLKAPLALLARRVGRQAGARPLAQSLAQLKRRREPWYRQAHFQVDASKPVAQVVAMILRHMDENAPQVLHDKTAR